MLDLGLLGLTNPWLLTALLSLPALWWLLRVIPPAPRRLRFPTIRFLLGLQPEEETSARTPPWLLALRLLLATLLILALAGPVLNPEPELSGEGPLVLVVDDGWAAAPHWEQRLAALERFTARAQRQEREVILLGTAPDPAGSALRRLSAADAARGVSSWLPKSWPADHDAALARLEGETFDDAEIIWLSDGIAEGPDARASAGRSARGCSGSARCGCSPTRPGSARCCSGGRRSPTTRWWRTCGGRRRARPRAAWCARSGRAARCWHGPRPHSTLRRWMRRRASSCPWSCATASPGSRSSHRRRSAAWRCSTSAGAAG